MKPGRFLTAAFRHGVAAAGVMRRGRAVVKDLPGDDLPDLTLGER